MESAHQFVGCNSDSVKPYGAGVTILQMVSCPFGEPAYVTLHVDTVAWQNPCYPLFCLSFSKPLSCTSQAGSDAASQAQAAAARKSLVALFEAAVDAYGDSDPSLWIEYAQFEAKHGGGGAGHTYWRAVKTLRDPDEFVDMYREALAGRSSRELVVTGALKVLCVVLAALHSRQDLSRIDVR